MSLIVFYFIAAIAIAFALLVVFSKNPVHSALYLIVAFFAIAGQYVLLNAQFLAIVHIIVYAGAIMVLLLFVLMLLNLNKETEPQKSVLVKAMAAVASGMLLLTLVGSLRGAVALPAVQNPNDALGLVKNLGQVLFTDFVVPFEVSSILFLAAMVGAVMIGKRGHIDRDAIVRL
jgi:NADH-quinone oxidoreductase subunit J